MLIRRYLEKLKRLNLIKRPTTKILRKVPLHRLKIIIRKEIIKLYGYVPFKDPWLAAGENASVLFRYGLPVVGKDVFLSPELRAVLEKLEGKKDIPLNPYSLCLST